VQKEANDFGERARLSAYLGFFNLFNRDNPAAVNGLTPEKNPGSNAPRLVKCCRFFPDRKGR
jgi:hypothetical protein